MPTYASADGPRTDAIRRKSARRRPESADFLVADIAARQHGVVSLEQLLGLGINERAVIRRVEAGRLYRIHQGVYAVGQPALTQNGKWMAAVLAGGPGAVLSHRSAAALWGIRDDERSSVDVTAPNRRGRMPHGIDAHRDGSIQPADRARQQGIPCTSVERTLLDLAAVVPIWELRKAISEAEVLQLLDHRRMRSLVRRSRGRRGVARLRLLLDEIHPETRKTRSELERMFLRMCERARIPRPEVNVSLDVNGRRLEPDFLWREAGLIVEADGRQYHDTDSAFQQDRKREQQLQRAGWRVSRCTWEQVEREPRRLAETIRALLAQPNPRRRA